MIKISNNKMIKISNNKININNKINNKINKVNHNNKDYKSNFMNKTLQNKKIKIQ